MKFSLYAFVFIVLLSVCILVSCGYANDRYDGGDPDKDGDNYSDGDDDIGTGGVGGRKVKNFIWTTVDGESLTLYDYEGYVILLSVGAGWCAECKVETPILENKFWKVYKDQDFVVIQTLTQDAGGLEADLDFAQQWQDEYGVTFPLCIDPNDSLKQYYVTPSLPFIMLIDRDLNIRERAHGFDEDIFKVLVESYL